MIFLTNREENLTAGYQDALARIQYAKDTGATLLYQDMFLRELPPEIGQLVNLQAFTLHSSALTGLPPEIGQLTNLTFLDLQNNDLLVTLPPEIGQLSNLEQLNVRRNALTRLPPEIGQLTHLKQLSLDGNPLESPPPDVVAQGLDAVLDYLRAQQEAVPDGK